MQNALALGLVGSRQGNGARRAASAYQFSRYPTGEPNENVNSSMSSICSSNSSVSSNNSSSNNEMTPTESSSSAMTIAASTTTTGSTTTTRSPLLCASTLDEKEWQPRGAVDKKNPFIGYFQMGNEYLAKTKEAESVVALSSMLNRQHKRLSQWWGSKSRIVSIFKPVEEEKEEEEYAVNNNHQLITKTQSERPSSTTTTTTKAEEIGSSVFNVTSSTSRYANDFEMECPLGQGGQGSVFKARNRVDGCYYAIKKVRIVQGMDRNQKELEQALREVKSMASMPPHVNVVRYHTSWIEKDLPSGTVSSELESASDESVHCSSSSSSAAHGVHMFSSISESRSLSSKELQEDIESFSIHSYSSSSLDSHNENSMFAQDGFTFEEPSELESTVKVMQATEEEDNQLQLEKLREKLSNIHSDAKKPEEPLTLYIQMELCGSTASGRNLGGYDHFYQGDEHHQHVQSFFEHVHSMHVQPRNTAKEHSSHSSLSSWLKATIEERSSSNPAIAAAKHREGLHFFLGAVQGVQHMHNCGVIHRDLKPDNIFIHGDVAKIGDFGLSKSLFSFETSASFLVEQKEKEQLMRLKRMMLGRDEYADQHTTALGTFTYASPEQLGSRFDHRLVLNGQVHAKSAKYSIKSDIFALGVILLELCCPFTTMMERSQVLTAVRHGVVPQKTLQKFPMEMALVLRMTAIHPSERPTSEEVAHQIKCLLSVDTVHVHSALDELQELQSKLAVAVMQLRDRSQVAIQLETLIAELSEKVQNVHVALA